MAAALTVKDQWSDGARLHVIGTIVLTSNYVATGDTVDLTGKGIQSQYPPKYARVSTRTANYKVAWIPGTTLANGKVKVSSQEPTNAGAGILPLTEHAVAAYNAALTADTLDFYAIFDFAT